MITPTALARPFEVIQAMVLAIVLAFPLRAQIGPDHCLFMEAPTIAMGPGGGVGPDCSPGDNWVDLYRHMTTYVPRPIAPVIPGAPKTLNVMVVVWQRTINDPDNYANTLANITSIANVIDGINDQLSFSGPPSDPVPVTADYYFGQTNIALELIGVNFLVNEALWGTQINGNPGLFADAIALNDAAHAAINGSEQYLLLHIVGPGSNGATFTAQPNDFDDHRSVVSHQHTADALFADDAAFYAEHWSHEIGHVLGLLHPYHIYSAGTNDVGLEACMGEEYLWDVLSVSNNDWCEPVNGGPGYSVQCPGQCFFQAQQQGVDPFAAVGDGFTNNIMGNNAVNDFISPLQMGRMHRTLMTTSTSQYAVGYGIEPLVVAYDETWDWRMKIYQDVRVRPGVTLTITCEIHMVPEASIIVEPGGRLIIDGGRVTIPRHATQRWRGIQVHGTVFQSQESTVQTPYPDWQGYLEIKNGGRVEHAEIGALIGDFTLNGGGGMVVINGDGNGVADAFINCRTGIAFSEYLFPQNSVLKYADFVRDVNYLTESDPDVFSTPAFLDLFGISGLQIEACDFSNTQTNAPESHLLAHGIRAVNSSFRVRGVCPNGGTCTVAEEDPCRFSGLDHPIHAVGFGTNHFMSVRGAQFANNICGVYTSGLPGYFVGRCEFVIGNNGVTLTGFEDEAFQDFHRGIYSNNGYGFLIRDNKLVESFTPTNQTEGVVIGYNRDHNDVVYRNEGKKLDYGFVGEGICAEVFNGQHRVLGLQFRCNDNDQNDYNIWSRKVSGAILEEQDFHTIRGFQGYRGMADNRFDRWPLSAPDKWDFHVTTEFTRLRYFHRDGWLLTSPYVPVSYDDDWFGLAGSNQPSPSTPCRGLQPEVVSGLSPEVIEDFLLAEKLAYADARYLYEQTIDDGNTDEVLQEISSAWPSEAWDLRQYLLSLSPNLSQQALKEAVNKTYFPMAMKAEVCVANPDATQSDGFVKWLEEEAIEPMPAYLIDLIKASWNTQTYRTELEMEMADRHAGMSQAANELLYLHHETAHVADQAYVRSVWQHIRTTAARYAEALSYITERNFSAAHDVITALPTDHELKDLEWQEQQRMLAYIGVLSTAHAEGRGFLSLSAAEVAQLEALRDGANDRAANWINNLLCHAYRSCRPPFTGGEVGDPKSGRSTNRTVVPKPDFLTAPNPAHEWVTFTYDLKERPNGAQVLVKDATGRTVAQLPMTSEQGQLLLDTRQLAQGSYSVHYTNQGKTLHVDKLIVQ